MIPVDLIKKESKILEREVRERTLGYILTALGLVAGLAWNEVIKSIISVIFPGEKNTIMAQLMYAAVVTVAVVVVASYLTRYFQTEEKEVAN